MLLAWTVGFLIGVLLWTFRLVGLVKVVGSAPWKFRADPGQGLLVIYRHPSMKEVLAVPSLFFPWYLLNRDRIPFQTPDLGNYYAPWWMAPLRSVLIPVERGSPVREARSFVRMRSHLRSGGTLAIAPEGGRTWKGEEFKMLTREGEIIIVPALEGARPNLKKPILRRFKSGVGKLAADGVPVLPIWVEPRWKYGLRIVVGEPVTFDVLPGREITEHLEDIMLQLAER
ncbi:MAG: 1-acyl-sn-glycerol-3-phosphate acyltransferase [bacterium]|nr:1-acyl-sn-glycerol-3-phosphate acyltransferase [bacterium]